MSFRGSVDTAFEKPFMDKKVLAKARQYVINISEQAKAENAKEKNPLTVEDINVREELKNVAKTAKEPKEEPDELTL